MLTLYMRPLCPFCKRVLQSAETLGISFDKKDIGDQAVAEELIKRGGKKQVPYLVDSERDVEMYESDDIISYLEEHYGPSVS